jgi:hypothetical protein
MCHEGRGEGEVGAMRKGLAYLLVFVVLVWSTFLLVQMEGLGRSGAPC